MLSAQGRELKKNSSRLTLVKEAVKENTTPHKNRDKLMLTIINYPKNFIHGWLVFYSETFKFEKNVNNVNNVNNLRFWK